MGICVGHMRGLRCLRTCVLRGLWLSQRRWHDSRAGSKGMERSVSGRVAPCWGCSSMYSPWRFVSIRLDAGLGSWGMMRA